MANIDTQSVKSSREQLRDRMASMYPDRNFSGEMGENGESGADDLDQAILEKLDELSSNQDTYTAKNKALSDLFYGDPLSAEFVQKWIETGDPRTALVETFGDDLKDLASEEGRSQFPEALKSWRDRRAENDSLNAEAEANWSKSLEDLESWGNEKGLTNEQKVNVMIRLVGVAANGIVNKYEPADFEMAWKEMNYDTDMNNARQEGEVAGRNAKIDENRKRRQAAGMMPPTLNGQGAHVEERKPVAPQSVWSQIK